MQQGIGGNVAGPTNAFQGVEPAEATSTYQITPRGSAAF
jgi:hypothetical protein